MLRDVAARRQACDHVAEAAARRLRSPHGHGRGEALAVLEALSADPFDIVLMDLQMPMRRGLDAARAIRTPRTAAQATPIVMVTANATPEDEHARFDAGADLHMTKPIRPHFLRTTVVAFGALSRA